MADPAPSIAECFTQLGYQTRLLQKLTDAAGVDATNLTGVETAWQAVLEGTYQTDALKRWQAERSKLSSILAPDTVRALLYNHLLEIGRAMGIPSRDIGTLVRDIRDYLHTNTQTIQRRGLTLGTPAAGGSNVGSGALYRITTDRKGYAIESTFLESKRCDCVADQGQTEQHEEEFLFKGLEAERDNLLVVGSGMGSAGEAAARLKSVSARNVKSFLRNPSFDSHDASADGSSPGSTTGITDWTIAGAAANVHMHSSAYYRGSHGVTTPWCAEFQTNETLSQQITGAAGKAKPKFLVETPYHWAVALCRKTSCDGTLTVTLGASTMTKDITTLTNDVWTVLYQSTASKCYYDTFNANNLTFSLALASRTTGTLMLDDVILYPYTNMDGTYYCLVGGATPFLRDDCFTWTDALTAADAVNQYWLWRAGLPSLPHAASPTYADPS